MYVIGAGALSAFGAAHPAAAPALRALAARLGAEAYADASALAAALGPQARAEGHTITLDLAAHGVRVQLAYDADAAVVVVTGVEGAKR